MIMFGIQTMLIIVLWMTLAAGTDDQPYCALRYKRLCQGKGRHVACQFSDAGPGASCVNYTAIKFNNDMKNFILFYVNRNRPLIAPEYPLMKTVGVYDVYQEWDRELSFLAQRLADQCHFVHDNCRATVRYPYAGQTVGEVRWRASGEPVERGARRAIRRVLDAWWGERRRAAPHQLTAPFRMPVRGAVWGHFSQLCVWGLQAMGCGAVHHGESHPRLLLVCDFSHTNMLGQRTLTPGPLAPCPIHTMRRPRTQYPLLCAPVRHPIAAETEEEYDKDEDDDLDPGLTVEMEDVPTPSIHYARAREKERTTVTYQTETSVLVFREDLKSRTKSFAIEQLDRELEIRNKAEQKSQMTEAQVIQEWRSRRPYLGQWRELQESVEMIPSHTTLRPESLMVTEYYRLTTGTSSENYQRYRWKQTRDRPLRPGANALLVTQPVVNSKRQSAASLMLDNEDVDQLFRDTGFKMKRKEQ